MSNYTKTTNFASKDNLSPGNPLKIVKGAEIDTEFNNIQTAVGTKTDNASANITGGSITGITDLAVADGGTGASTATAALNNLLPSQSGNDKKYLQTDGTNATWDAVSLSTSDITGTLPVANGGTGVTSSTGTGSVVLSNSPTLVTPALGTPASGTATNLTGLPISTGVSGLGTGVATFLATPSSANLASAVTDETGSGALVFANSPTLVTPALGTPSALVGTNITGTASGLTAGNVTTNANLTGAITSTGNATSLGSFSSANLLGALTDETGTGSAVFATSPTLVTPILGTPTSATLTNATGLPISTGVSGLGTGVATALAVNVGSSGAPLVNGGVLGTPSSGTVTNLTGTASININGTVGATTANTGAFTSLTATSGVISANSSSDALRITQVGAGNALLVEDDTNPDSTPFVINADGRVISGTTTVLTASDGLIPRIATYNGQLGTFRYLNDSASNSFLFNKSRGTGTTQTIVQSGDALGLMNFAGSDGTNFISSARIEGAVDGTPGTNDMPGRLVFSTTADGASSPTERVRIASTGAIGLSGANYGTSGQVLTSGGSSATPTWTTVSGSGDVVGPASSTDNAFARFDSTTGKLLQNSTGATLSDTGGATFTGSVDVAGTSTAGSNIKLYEDTDNGTNYVSFKAPDTISANVTWTLPSADGTSNQVLSTNGSGTLSWATAGGGSSQWTTTGSDIYYNTGNVAVGSTSVVASTGKSYQLGSNVLLQNVVNGQLMLSQNAVYDSTWKYITAARAAAIRIGAQNDGEVTFHYSNAVGTAGGALSNWDSNKSMVITQTGQVLVGPTSAQSGGCNFQVSQGITFPATQSASTDANTLDDYEEGSWTAVLSDGTNNATMTASRTTGSYTKIGNFVTVCGYISTDSLGSVSGNVRITGLPFQSASGNANYSGAALGYGENLNITANQVVSAYVPINSSYFLLMLWDLASGTSQMQATEWSNDGAIIFNISYRV